MFGETPPTRAQFVSRLVPIGVFCQKHVEIRSWLGKLAGFPTSSWEAMPTAGRELRKPPMRCARKGETKMLGNILGAIAGEKIAGRNNKVAGALLGAAVPAIARRGLGTLGLVAVAGWGAKKLIDRSRGRKSAEARRQNQRTSA
jgi:hypothetical protein